MYGISEKSVNQILKTIASYPEVEQVLIFGSRAKGNFKPGSDIDLAITGPDCTTETAIKMRGILNETVPIPYHVDIICMNDLQHTELKEHILRVGQVFYKSPNHS